MLEQFDAATKISTDGRLINSLRDLGQAHARLWLTEHRSALGVTSTVNISRDYLDDLRMPVNRAEPEV